MRIATWNVNGLRARLDFVRIWLEARQPDVVGLQELKVGEDEFPALAFRDLGFDVVVHGQRAWNGVAILTRHRAEPAGFGLPGQEAFGARLVGARIAGLHFTTVYCPNGKDVGHEDYPNKLAWYDDLAKFWSSRVPAGDAAVLCGDFNVVPAPIDSWRGAAGDGAIFHTPQERSRFGALLDLGLVDLYREKHPDTRAFSWWDYRGGSLPPRPGAAHRLPARHETDPRASRSGGDRPRLPQEEGGPHRLRSRPRDCGSGLDARVIGSSGPASATLHRFRPPPGAASGRPGVLRGRRGPGHAAGPGAKPD